MGWTSNSSTASFLVKIKPDWADRACHPDDGPNTFVLPEKKVELLKKCGFKPTKRNSPFRFKYPFDGDKEPIEDVTYLAYTMVCNQDFVLQFLVAHDIPFTASVHYDHHLYSYEAGDDYIYILNNFGMEYMFRPKEIESEMKEREWRNFSPYEKMPKEAFLEGYNEKESLQMMNVDTDLL